MAVIYADDYVTGDGTNEQSALQAAFDAAEDGVLIFSDAGKDYVIGEGYAFGAPADLETLVIRKNTRIINSGAKFIIQAGREGPGATTAIRAEAGVRADFLRIYVGAGFTVNRAFSIAASESTARTFIDRIEISTFDHQKNRSAISDDLQNAALVIRADNTTLGEVITSNFDYAAVAYDVSHILITHLRIERFVRGLLVDRCTYFELLSGEITGRPPVYDGTEFVDEAGETHIAGYDGILMSNTSDAVISNLIVKEPVEHGIYVSADQNVNVDRITFNNIQISKPGRSGLKISPGSNGQSHARFVQINGLTVVDCAWDLAGLSRDPPELIHYRNSEGLRLEFCKHITVNGLMVSKLDHTASAARGIYMDRCSDVTINGPYIESTHRHGIWIMNGAKADDSPEEFAGQTSEDLERIFINNPVILFMEEGGAGEGEQHGIYISCIRGLEEEERQEPTRKLRDIRIVGCYIRGQNGHGIRIEADPGTVRQPVILHGWVRGGGNSLGAWDIANIDRDINDDGLTEV